MRLLIPFNKLPWNRPQAKAKYSLWHRFHLDAILLLAIVLLMFAGAIILYSASNENIAVVERQLIRFLIGLCLMFILAQIPPNNYRIWAPWLFAISLLLLVAVLIIGHTGKGAERWLNLYLIRFQPSELMKVSLPLMLAWYFHQQPLPPSLKSLAIGGGLMLVPGLLIAKQPDLGTAILIMTSGIWVIILAGLSWRIMLGLGSLFLAILPFVWHFMHGYQKNRVLTFLNPERDPLGTGYHIIQSKIAIGSGGIFGKGWLQGTQSHLQFLPEHKTDFIFAVCGEEFGLLGSILLLSLYLFIMARCLFIATQAQDTFSRLLAGSLGLTFFISAFINMGMVTGILPVVGVPLPLVSYGGTSMVTVLAGFGLVMSIHTHRNLVAR